MKTLTGKVRAVKREYLKLDREIANFTRQSGLHCIKGCGECCKKPDIEATPLEFLPLALKLFDEGIVNCRDHVIRMLQAVANNVENALPVTNIDITIQEDGTIIMINDGNGIDVVQHPEYKT